MIPSPHTIFFISLRIDVLLEFLAAVLGLTISLLSLEASRRLGSRTLLYLGLGFLLMALAMLSRTIAVTALLSAGSLPEIGRLGIISQLITLELLYSVIRISSYIVFIYLYVTTPPAPRSIPALAAIIFNPSFELVSAILLLPVVYRTGQNSLGGDNPFAWTVFTGFALLLASHLAFLFSGQSFTFYLAGHLLQLLALSLFFLALVLVRSDEKRV